jgi:hypothetical protein
VKVDIVLVLVDLCRIMGEAISSLNNGKLGLGKVANWILAHIFKAKLKVSFLTTFCNLLFHFSILGVFLLMQVLYVPSLLLFFYKFFSLFFCKEGLKEDEPPS